MLNPLRKARSLPAKILINGLNLAPSPTTWTARATWTGDVFIPVLTNQMDTSTGNNFWQIDQAKAAGANTIRVQLDPVTGCYGSYYVASSDFATNMAWFLDKSRVLARYVLGKGMWFYPNLWPLLNVNPGGNTSIAAAIAPFVRAMQDFPHVIGVDVFNEVYNAVYQGTNQTASGSLNSSTTITRSAMNTMVSAIVTAVKSVAKNVPITVSLNEGFSGSALWNSQSAQDLAPLVDFLDFHTYSQPTPSDAQSVYSNSAASGKPFICGEYGANPSSNQPAFISAMQSITNATYSGQPGCKGTAWWSVATVFNSGGDTNLIDASGSHQPGYTTFQAGPSTRPLIQFNSVRRRAS